MSQDKDGSCLSPVVQGGYSRWCQWSQGWGETGEKAWLQFLSTHRKRERAGRLCPGGPGFSSRSSKVFHVPVPATSMFIPVSPSDVLQKGPPISLKLSVFS